MGRRKKHNSGWSGVTNSCKSKPETMRAIFSHGKLLLEIDNTLIGSNPRSVRNILEELADLALELQHAFLEGFVEEQVIPEVSPNDKESVPFDWVCESPFDDLEPVDFRSTPNEIGNISLDKIRKPPILLQSEAIAAFWKNVALQTYEFHNSILQHKTPYFMDDLTTYFNPELYNVQKRARYEQISMKNALYLSAERDKFNSLFEHYKVALHEINVLTSQINLLTNRISRSIQMKKSQRSRYVNAKPKANNNLLSQFFSFLEKQNGK